MESIKYAPYKMITPLCWQGCSAGCAEALNLILLEAYESHQELNKRLSEGLKNLTVENNELRQKLRGLLDCLPKSCDCEGKSKS